jgi:rubrerythrin
MNLNNIFNEIEKIDPEVYERTSDRRNALKSFGKKVALAAVPIAMGSLFKKAYAQTTLITIEEILNYALTLEYLEYNFYSSAISANVIPGTDLASFQTIMSHEGEHVTFLQTAITALGATPVDQPTFDFTAGGHFADVFTNYQTFLAVSQTFEDTGVRAYKGQAAGLKSNRAILTAALQIHSTEARHAAHVRRLRNLDAWISSNLSGIYDATVQPAYNGEDTTSQLNINLVNINGTGITAIEATQAFDEPLDMATVNSLANLFIVH